MLTVIASYLLSAWEVTETTRSLHIINVFLVYVCFYMFTGKDLNVGWAYVMSFLCLWTVDMVRSYELVLAHEEGPNTFYYGVGGAGLNDGLVIFPFMTVLIIYYARWRIKMTRRLSA